MGLSLKTLTSIIRTGLPILVELIDLVNSFIIFLSQMTLLRWLTFLLESHTVILRVLLFWIYLFLLMLVFVLQWVSLHWKILIIFSGVDTGCSRHWCTDCGAQMSTFSFWISPWMPHFIALLMTILVLIGTVFVIIREMFQGRMPLNLVLLQLLVNFVNGLRLKLMYISLIESIR